MDTNLVWWILALLFLGVGLHLFLYSRRRKKLLERFANAHQFFIKTDLKEELQQILDDSFSLQQENLLRTFDQLSSIIYDESIWIFRAVELIDLNPHAHSYSTHFSRIIALFKVSQVHKEFFLLDKDMDITQRLPGATDPASNIRELFRECSMQCDTLPHSLSVTFSNGYGLIYYEPLVVGGESLSDINTLYCIAKKIRLQLSNDA